MAGFDPVETDSRTVPWPTVRRLALEAGLFPPVYQPVTEDELADLLDSALDEAMSGQAGNAQLGHRGDLEELPADLAASAEAAQKRWVRLRDRMCAAGTQEGMLAP